MSVVDQIKHLDPCSKSIAWLRKYDDLQTAWDECERGDWMLWYAGMLSGPPESEGRKPLVLAACACARLVLPYVPEGETRPLQAIETAERWANGEALIRDVRKDYAAAYDASADAAAAAYDASADAYAYADAAAANAAAAADAYAADAAAYDAAAYAAYDAAAYAAYADAADAAYDARWSALKQCADIVRKFYPLVPKSVISIGTV